eukprot:XP_765307.1 hypothetical protein [Theileria parva strain Muguga]
MLYNNYKLLLKKYNELNEEKMSYVEGLKEYRNKLDNSNHLLQLQRNIILSYQQYNPSSFKQLELELKNKESKLKALESELKNKEELLHSLESELQTRESTLNDKESELANKQSDLENRETTLQFKESELRTKELELNEKESQLNNALANNMPGEFSNTSLTSLTSDDSDLFPSNSLESEQSSPNSQLNESAKTLDNTTNMDNVGTSDDKSSDKGPTLAATMDKSDFVNNDIINSLYIKVNCFSYHFIILELEHERR